MTYQELLKYGESALMEERIPGLAVQMHGFLFQYVFRMNRLDYLMHLSGHADAGKEEQYRALIRKRQTHYPLQYITHEQNFMGLDFYVDENVLIPRQDTEVLVEHTLKFVRDDMRVLDMCTGSGCIIVSIAANRRLARAAGADLSEAALRIAAQNAAVNHVPDIEWIQSDLFADICGTFDVIVSNPPYIPSGEIETLMCEVKQYEPVMALDGSGDGLAFYRKIIAEAKEYLSENGMLFLEIGWNQAEDVSRLMETAGYTGIYCPKRSGGAGSGRLRLPSLDGGGYTIVKKITDGGKGMFDRLDDLLIRYQQVMEELGDPEVANDQTRFRKLMKEQSELSPIAEKYTEYKQTKKNIDDSLELLETGK